MWPNLNYSEFKETGYLLHMLIQAIGKLKLTTVFEPQWSNVPLLLTSRGLTTGIIPYKDDFFEVEVDLISHQVICSTAFGRKAIFRIMSDSVANLVSNLFEALRSLKINIPINMKPQEIPNPIEFDKDTKIRIYRPDQSHLWWQILLRSYHVMQQYHAKFTGKAPPIALMWGTLDLREVRFNELLINPTGINSGYIRRNAMDAAQIEMGWWAGNDLYPRPAYYSFTYPQPEGIEEAKLEPDAAKWHKELGEFILDYDALMSYKNPEKELLAFCHSTYEAGAKKAGWDPKLSGVGVPI